MPYMPLYYGEVQAATVLWRGEERALLITMMALSWCAAAPLPVDTERLASAAGYEVEHFERLWETVKTQFHRVNDGWIHHRVEELRAHAKDLRAKRTVASNKGVEARRRKAIGEPNGQPDGDPVGMAAGSSTGVPLGTSTGDPSGQPTEEPFRAGKVREESEPIRRGLPARKMLQAVAT